MSRITHWGATAFLIALGVWRTLASIRQEPEKAAERFDWCWGALVFLALLVGRWPWIVDPHELNTDESQMIVGAHTLLSHPVFWRTVDGSTSGPMNFFVVIPLGVLSGWEGFVHARILALLLLSGALCHMYFGMVLLHGRTTARLALMPGLVIEALSESTDFNHYSTELLPLYLLSAAFHLVSRYHTLGLSPVACGLGGLLLGMVPVAKLQAVPIAAMQGLVWAILLLHAWRRHIPRSRARMAWLGLGVVLPCGAFAMQVAIAGEWDNMLKSYVLANRYYVEMGAAFSDSARTMIGMARIVVPNFQGAWLLAVALLIGGLLSFRDMIRSPVPLLLAMGATMTALVCVALPGRPYPHYLQLIILPLTWLCALVIESILENHSSWLRKGFVLAVPVYALTVLFVRLENPPPPLVRNDAESSEKRFSRQVAEHIRPGEPLAVWGWSSYLYVETQTTQATRRAMSQLMFESGPLLLHFRRQYLLDLMISQPSVFVDSTGPMSLFYRHHSLRHELQFSALGEYIATNYTQVGEYRQARIYRRNDSPSLEDRSQTGD